jgi:hypothetical protein
VTLEKAKEIVLEFYSSVEFLRLMPTTNAKGGLNRPKAKGYELFTITSRPDFTCEKTLGWLEREFGKTFDSRNTFFTGRFFGEKQNKGEICKRLKINYIVEDDFYHLKSCLENNIKILLYDKPWNRGYTGTNSLIKRVKSLSEIESVLS